MNSSTHPWVLIAILGVAFGLGSIIVAFKVRRIIARIGTVLLAAVFIVPAVYVLVALHPEWVDARFRAYKAFYGDLEEGMRREQVMVALEKRYPVEGPRGRPSIMEDTPTSLGFFMNPETSREPNCEGIFLTLDQGRVTRIVYLAD